MKTIRTRLTVWYTVAMAVVIVAFGAALVIERRHPSFDELDERLQLESDVAVGWLSESQRVLGGQITIVDSVPGREGSWVRRTILAPTVSTYLESMRDPLVVVDTQGNLIYASQQSRSLSYNSLENLVALLRPRPSARVTGTVNLDPHLGAYRYFATRIPVGGLLIATPALVSSFEPRELIRSRKPWTFFLRRLCG